MSGRLSYLTTLFKVTSTKTLSNVMVCKILEFRFFQFVILIRVPSSDPSEKHLSEWETPLHSNKKHGDEYWRCPWDSDNTADKTWSVKWFLVDEEIPVWRRTPPSSAPSFNIFSVLWRSWCCSSLSGMENENQLSINLQFIRHCLLIPAISPFFTS